MPSRKASTYYVAGRSEGTSFAPLLWVVRDCLVLDRATFQLEITVSPVTRPQFHLEFRNSSKQTKKPFSPVLSKLWLPHAEYHRNGFPRKNRVEKKKKYALNYAEMEAWKMQARTCARFWKAMAHLPALVTKEVYLLSSFYGSLHKDDIYEDGIGGRWN